MLEPLLLGFAAVVATVFLGLFVWCTRSRRHGDDAADDHAEWPGADAGFSIHKQGV